MERTEMTRPKPTIEEKLYYFQQMYEKPETGDLQANIDELKDFARGEGEEETREEWYHGWTKEDFQELLHRLEEEGIIKE